MKVFAKWLLYILALTPLVVTKSLFFPFISGKSILMRLILTLVSVLLVFLLFDKKNFQYFRGKITHLFRNKIFIFICVFFLISIISTLVAGNSFRAFFGDIERAEGLITLLYLFGFFILTVLLFEQKDWVRFFRATLCVGFVLFVHEMIQLAGGADRPASFTGNPIYLAAIFLFVIFSALLVIADMRTRPKEGGSWNLLWIVLSCGMIPVSVFGIFVTRTRGVIAGLIVSAVVLLIYFALKGKDRMLGAFSFRKLSLGLLGLIILVGVLFALTSRAGFWRYIPGFDRLSEFTLNDPTLQTRLISLGVSLKAIHPADNGIVKFLVGWGPENFNIAYNAYYNPEYFRYETAWFDRAHNKLMDVFVMQGVLGLCAYIGIWVLILWAFLKKRPSWESFAILFFGVSYFIQNLFVFDSIVTYIPFFSFLAYSVFIQGIKGFGHSLEQKTHREHQQPKQGEKQMGYTWFSWGWTVLSVFFLISFIAWTIIPYGQTHSYIKLISASTSVSQDDVFKTFVPYTFAQELLRQQYLRSTVSQYTGKENEEKLVLLAIDKVSELISREPYNPRYFITLGDAYDSLGKKSSPEYFVQAQLAYEKAHKLAPDRQDIYYLMAYNLAFQKRFDEAIKILEHAISLDPKVSGPHFYLGMILVGTNDSRNYTRALDELLLGQELSNYSFNMNKNGPQALHFLLSYFYQQRDIDGVIKISDALEILVPGKKADIEIIRNEAKNGTWGVIKFQ